MNCVSCGKSTKDVNEPWCVECTEAKRIRRERGRY